MPLELPHTSNCPFMLESDILSLSPSFMVTGKTLQDVPIGAAHKLTPPADVILTALTYGITFRSLLGLSEELGLHQIQVLDILGFLNSAGALRRRRSIQGHVEAARYALTYAFTGVIHPGITWRQRFSARALAKATLKAAWPVEAALGAVCTLGIAGRMVSPITGVAAALYSGTLFLCSIYAHEYMHVMLLRAANLKMDVRQSRLRLGIIHKPAPAKIEIKAALAGPAAGTALCLPGIAIGLMLDVSAVWVASLCIALVHLLALLPMYSDGVTIRNALKSRASS